jgi:maleylacetate reductase
MEFEHRSQQTIVHFGLGSRHRLRDLLQSLELKRLLVLSTPGQEALAREVTHEVGDLCAGIHPHARMHVPRDIAEETTALCSALGIDGLLPVGGGSTIGLAKAVARRTGHLIVAVPTTYAGSEMTPLWGETFEGTKTTGTDAAVVPRAVIYDPELTVSLPVGSSVTSAFNAMAHAAEALYSPEASPLLAMAARESIRSAMSSAALVVEAPKDLEGRTGLLYAAWLAGMCLGGSTMGLHHKLCHVLGGALDLPHAETHTVVLPHVLALNLPHAPEAQRTLTALFEAADPAREMQAAARAWGGPTSLAQLGMTELDIPTVVQLALQQPYPNPVPVDRRLLTTLLEAALQGDPL